MIHCSYEGCLYPYMCVVLVEVQVVVIGVVVFVVLCMFTTQFEE